MSNHLRPRISARVWTNKPASGDDDTDIPILDDPQDGHGTAVTGAVLNANPDAVIFFVEGFSDAAVLAAANQPLVDIITGDGCRRRINDER